jgi:predicted phosphohydrolase
MDFFGGIWENYVQKIIDGFSNIEKDDTVVIAGDVSWGMNLKEAREDFIFLSRLPGEKAAHQRQPRPLVGDRYQNEAFFPR